MTTLQVSDLTTGAVLANLTALADADGLVTIGARGLADHVGCGRGTAHRALRRLIDEGRLAVEQLGKRAGSPTAYRLTLCKGEPMCWRGRHAAGSLHDEAPGRACTCDCHPWVEPLPLDEAPVAAPADDACLCEHCGGEIERAATGRRPRFCCTAHRVAAHRARVKAGPPAPDPVESDRTWVIVACGADKLDHRAPAGQLYTGSYHRACRRAAQQLAPAHRTLILSGLHGLLPLDEQVAPYNVRIDSPDGVDPLMVSRQMRDLGIARAGTRVIVLGGREYSKVIRAAVRELNNPRRPDRVPMARGALAVDLPLAGTHSMGEQLARLAKIAAS